MSLRDVRVKKKMKNDPLGLKLNSLSAQNITMRKSTIIVPLCRRKNTNIFGSYCVHFSITGDDGYFLMFNLWCTKLQKKTLWKFSRTAQKRKSKIQPGGKWQTKQLILSHMMTEFSTLQITFSHIFSSFYSACVHFPTHTTTNVALFVKENVLQWKRKRIFSKFRHFSLSL